MIQGERWGWNEFPRRKTVRCEPFQRVEASWFYFYSTAFYLIFAFRSYSILYFCVCKIINCKPSCGILFVFEQLISWILAYAILYILPIYPTYISYLYILPIYPLYISYLYIRSIYPTSISALYIRPIYLNYILDLYIISIYPIYIFYLYIRPIYLTYISELYIQPIYPNYIFDLYIRPVYY